MTLLQQSNLSVSLLIVGLCLGGLPLSVLSANAESYNSSTVEQPLLISQGSTFCEDAIWGTRATLEEGRDLTVTLGPYIISDAYDNYPTGRFEALIYFMKGSAATSIMNSPQYMSILATQIIQACGSVGIVQFGADESSWMITYGLLESGAVVPFQCSDPNTLGLTWGTVACP